MFMVRSLFLFLFALTTGISGVSAKTCKEEGKSIKSFALAVLLQLKLPNAAVQGKYFMNVIYVILILMMYKKIKLDFVLYIKVSPHFRFFILSIFVIEYFALLTPFLFTTFPPFYHNTSLSRDLCIRNKDGHLNSISCIEEGVASKVSTWFLSLLMTV